MKCKACKQDHDPMLTCQRAARLAEYSAKGVNTAPDPISSDSDPFLPVSAPVNTKPRNADRHKPGYMAEYMRAHRVKKKAAKNED